MAFGILEKQILLL
jgi:hypothetical protein